jgi:hypothetical protein
MARQGRAILTDREAARRVERDVEASVLSSRNFNNLRNLSKVRSIRSLDVPASEFDR